MTALKKYINSLEHPVFLIDSSSKTILFSNEYALKELNVDSGDELLVDEHLTFIEQPSGKRFTQLNGYWYQAAIQTIELPDDSFQLLELFEIEHIPDRETINGWKNMIAVMLHRLRSPLTGINGYLDMLEEEVDGNQLKHRFEAIHKGFNNIYDIMDELEILHNISPDFDDSDFSSVSVFSIINDILIGFNGEQKSRFTIHESVKKAAKVDTNADVLKKAIHSLMENALIHSVDENIQISYSPEHSGSISIKNKAAPLNPDIKKQIFHPFVTTRATNLGIGLTKALIYAFQVGGIIFLREEENSVTFTFKFPLA